MARINASDQGVRVTGLNELNRALRRMGPEFQAQLKETNKEVAEGVASSAQGMASGAGGVLAKVAPDIRASATNTRAGVTLGSAPYAAGAEFGGGARPTTQQFQPWRGSGESAGYAIYPTIRAQSEQIAQQYEEAVEKLKERVGLA